MKRKVSFLLISIILVLVFAVIPFLTACSSTSEETTAPTETSPVTTTEVIKLRQACQFPSESFWVKEIFQPWADKVNEVTEGRVEITLFPGESLINVVDAYDNVQAGIADISEGCPEYTPGRFPLSMAGELPFLKWNSATSASIISQLLYEEFPEIQAEYPDVKVLGFFCVPLFQIYTSDTPVYNMADLDGLKIRCGGGPLVDALEAIGVSPTVLSAGGQYEAIQKGTVDGTLFPTCDVNAFNLGEVVSYCAEVNLITTPFFFIMNNDSFNKLSAADQEAIMNLSGEYFAQWVGEICDQQDELAKELLQEQGVEFINISDEAMAEFRAATNNLLEEWIDEMESGGLPGGDILDRLQELSSEYNK